MARKSDERRQAARRELGAVVDRMLAIRSRERVQRRLLEPGEEAELLALSERGRVLMAEAR